MASSNLVNWACSSILFALIETKFFEAINESMFAFSLFSQENKRIDNKVINSNFFIVNVFIFLLFSIFLLSRRDSMLVKTICLTVFCPLGTILFKVVLEKCIFHQNQPQNFVKFLNILL